MSKTNKIISVFLIALLIFTLLSMTVFAQNVTLNLSPPNGKVGDEITASGIADPDEWVSIKIVDVQGNIVYYDAVKSGADGGYGNTFKIPDTKGETLIVVAGYGSNVDTKTLKLGYTVTFMSDGEVYKTETVEADYNLNEPVEPTKDGYKFDGWYEDEDFNNKAIFPYTVTEDVTFYAEWTEELPEKYTVTFMSDGEVYKTETVEADQALNEPAEPTKDGYKFDGWYEDEDFNNKATFPYTVTEDVTFYAKWTEESPEISYEYIVTPREDAAVYDIGQTADGIKTMKVKNGIEGLKYFKVNIQSSGDAHEGKETAVFVHLRDGKQLSINITFADFDDDTIDEAGAGFNVEAGDIIKVYIVDKLTNDPSVNPILLQK